MEEVTVVQPKKVIVVGYDEAVMNSVSNNKRLHQIVDDTPADIIVCIWDVDTHGSYQRVLEQKLRKDTLVVFVCTQETLLDAQQRNDAIAELRSWTASVGIHTKVVNLPVNSEQGKGEFDQVLNDAISLIERREETQRESQEARERQQREQQEILDEARIILGMKRAGTIGAYTPGQLSILTRAAEITKPRSPAPRAMTPESTNVESYALVPVVPSAQRASFFGYGFANPEQASISHSRQVRNQYGEEKLRFEESDTPETHMKKLVLLFAHYMSIKDIKSTLSQRMEAILAAELMSPVDQAIYTRDREINRATFFGKNDDRVAIELRRLLLTRYGVIKNDFLNSLIELLRPVDTLETSFSHAKKGKRISALMEEAESFYDEKMQKKAEEKAGDIIIEAEDVESELAFVMEHPFSFYCLINQPLDSRSCEKRLQMLDDDLTPEKHDVKNYTLEQLLKVFAHYMSVDAKSPVSKILEDRLVSALFDQVEYFDYQRRKESFFARFRMQGIKESVSRLLSEKIDAKIQATNDEGLSRVWTHVPLLTVLLEGASRIENTIKDNLINDYKFTPRDEREALIANTITVVDRVCEHLSTHPDLENTNLTNGLVLPEDVISVIDAASHPRLER